MIQFFYEKTGGIVSLKKSFKITIFAILFVFVLLVLVIYPIVVWNVSKSPDELSGFPKSGRWVCEGEGFTIEIDLSDEAERTWDNAIGAKSITFSFGGREYPLSCECKGGHGTLLVPTAPAEILCFESEGEGDVKIKFHVSKYKFEADYFLLLDIYPLEQNEAACLKDGMDLRFDRILMTVS